MSDRETTTIMNLRIHQYGYECAQKTLAAVIRDITAGDYQREEILEYLKNSEKIMIEEMQMKEIAIILETAEKK